jgi:hypothetical protein
MMMKIKVNVIKYMYILQSIVYRNHTHEWAPNRMMYIFKYKQFSMDA